MRDSERQSAITSEEEANTGTSTDSLTGDDSGTGMPNWAFALIVALSLLIIAACVIVILLVRKNRKDRGY